MHDCNYLCILLYSLYFVKINGCIIVSHLNQGFNCVVLLCCYRRHTIVVETCLTLTQRSPIYNGESNSLYFSGIPQESTKFTNTKYTSKVVHIKSLYTYFRGEVSESVAKNLSDYTSHGKYYEDWVSTVDALFSTLSHGLHLASQSHTSNFKSYGKCDIG